MKQIKQITLSILLAGSTTLFANTQFDKTLELNNIAFHVTSPNDGSLNKITIQTKGLRRDTVDTNEVDGTVTDATVADLNNDGAPEIYIFVTSAGSGSYGSVIAYSSNKNISITPIYMEELAQDSKILQGYMGHDTYKIEKNRLVRRFPVYGKGNTNAKPGSHIREIRYKLNHGEAAWQLKVAETKELTRKH